MTVTTWARRNTAAKGGLSMEDTIFYTDFLHGEEQCVIISFGVVTNK